MSPTLADVYEARRVIAGKLPRTPLLASSLSDRCGREILLKLETLQPIGAFKLRGAVNAIARLDAEQRKRGVVCCSTGNHGRAVAYAAKQQGIRAVVCLSELVPSVKVAAVEALGAEVRRVGRSQDDAQIEATRLVAEQGMIDVPPFDHPDVIAGQGTIGLELLEDRPDIETILVPLSGGGLIAGIAIAAKTIKPTLRILGISMERGAAMAASLEAGRPIEVEEVPSLADSLGGGIGLGNRHTYRLCRELVDEVVQLSEVEIYRGIRSLFFDDRLVAEGASAVGHAALLAGRIRLTGPTAIVVTGRNVDMAQFADVVANRPVQLGDLTVTGEGDG